MRAICCEIHPEAALRRRRLRCLGGELGLRVHVVQRQVAPDIAEVAEIGEELVEVDNSSEKFEARRRIALPSLPVPSEKAGKRAVKAGA